MIKKLRLFTLFIGLIGCFLLNGHNVSWATEPSEQKIDAILIQSASVGKGAQSTRKNPAILITDAAKIKQYKSLFLNNHRFLHACGYTYDIQFWAGAQLYEEIPYNMECGLEEFEKHTQTINQLMQSVHKQFQTQPGYSIYVLKVPVAQEPLALAQKMRQEGLNVFLFNGLDSRYPSVEVIYTYKGKDHDGLEEAAKKQGDLMLGRFIQQTPTVIKHSDFEYYGGEYSSGNATVHLRSKLVFKLGTDLKTISTEILKSGFEIKRTAVPKYYSIALVDSEENPEKIKQKLLSCSACQIVY